MAHFMAILFYLTVLEELVNESKLTAKPESESKMYQVPTKIERQVYPHDSELNTNVVFREASSTSQNYVPIFGKKLSSMRA